MDAVGFDEREGQLDSMPEELTSEEWLRWVKSEEGLRWLGNLTKEDLQRLKREEERKIEESKRRVIEHLRRKLRGD